MTGQDLHSTLSRPHGSGEAVTTTLRHGLPVADQLADDRFDLLVIGAGINGAGIARDAAMRGLRVLLLDKGDIASGTTSWSSRLIHGGLRYLEYGEVGLVRESLHERETLLHIAAHLVRPLPLMIPIYESDRRGKGLVRLGMIGYDVLSTGKSLERHRMLSPEAARARAGGLATDGLTGAALYYDGQVEYAERLAVENAIDAVDHGATVLTYCRVDDLIMDGRRVTGVIFTDLLGGTQHRVSAAVVVNVTGPWVDATLGRETMPETPVADSTRHRAAAGPDETGPDGANPAAEADVPVEPFVNGGTPPESGTIADIEPDKESVVAAGQRFLSGFLAQFHSNGLTSGRLIGGTKGSHIIVAPFDGAPQDALYVEAHSDGRPFFIIPWNDLYLIGTTDVRYEGDLDRVVASDEEIAYLIAETNRVLPSAGLTRERILYTYSGIRPLPYHGDGAEGAVTRRHLVLDHEPDASGLISIVGGKLTTFRELAEQTVDMVYAKLDRPSAPCRTASEPLPGSRLQGSTITRDDLPGFAASFARLFPALSEATVAHLIRTYGTRAAAIATLAQDDPDLAMVIDDDHGAIGAEIVYAVQREGAQRLTDILLRRTMLGYGPDNAIGADERAAAIAGSAVGWDADQQTAEVLNYREFISRYRPRALEPTGVTSGSN
jgi:glycerol-3-phosphate dehydrogenase